MKRSDVADLNSTAFIIAACFSHGYLAAALFVLAFMESVNCYIARKREGRGG